MLECVPVEVTKDDVVQSYLQMPWHLQQMNPPQQALCTLQE